MLVFAASPAGTFTRGLIVVSGSSEFPERERAPQMEAVFFLWWCLRSHILSLLLYSVGQNYHKSPFQIQRERIWLLSWRSTYHIVKRTRGLGYIWWCGHLWKIQFATTFKWRLISREGEASKEAFTFQIKGKWYFWHGPLLLVPSSCLEGAAIICAHDVTNQYTKDVDIIGCQPWTVCFQTFSYITQINTYSLKVL